MGGERLRRAHWFLSEYLRGRRNLRLARSALLAHQAREVRRYLRWAIAHSPYTRERFGSRPLEDWRSLPVMDKASMMANFDRLNTAGLRRDEALEVARGDERSRRFDGRLHGYSVGLSSGTSGRLGLFVTSEEEQVRWAGLMLSRVLPGPLLSPQRDRVAFFLRANNALYEQVGSRRLTFRFFDLAEPLERQLERLEDLDPTVLVAPPSLLRRLAATPSAAILRPKRTLCVAEPLEDVDRALFFRAFAAPVHQIYQATEGFLAATCAFGTLHLNEDAIVVQREELGGGRFVPIITDFRRTTQPIIRYRLDDVLLAGRPCPCGSPMSAIAAVEGRLGDVLEGRRRAGGTRPIYADFVRRSVLLAANIEDYGVRQVGERLELFVQPREHTDAVAAALRALFKRFDCVEPAVQVLQTWPVGGVRKRKRIERIDELPA